jgi:hypothetical protein
LPQFKYEKQQTTAAVHNDLIDASEQLYQYRSDCDERALKVHHLFVWKIQLRKK